MARSKNGALRANGWARLVAYLRGECGAATVEWIALILTVISLVTVLLAHFEAEIGVFVSMINMTRS